MAFRAIRDLLLPRRAERDEGFLQEILRDSHAGLKLVGAAALAYPALLLLSWLFLGSDWPGLRAMAWQAGACVALGAVALAATRIDRAYEHSRALAWLLCWLLAVTLVACSRRPISALGSADRFVLIHVTLVMLLAVAVIPFRPLQTLALGLAIGLFRLACSAASAGAGTDILTQLPQDGFDLWFIVTLTALSVLLTAVLYGRRRLTYQANLQLLRSSQDLRRAQMKVMLSDHAASLGRLAAAMSHELNTPMGVLRSSVDTLLAIAAKQALAPASDQPRLLAAQADVRGSMLEAIGRLESIVGRIQRFTNLDRAEVQSVDLNDLLRDITGFLAPQSKEKVNLELDLQPLAPILCRPQQLSAVFSNLLANAIEAVPEHGTVKVSTRQRDSRLEVRIQDNGRGIPQEEMGKIFDPDFKVSGRHVSMANWSLFNCRRIIQQLGGDLRLTSQPGSGTTVRITLPCQAGVLSSATHIG